MGGLVSLFACLGGKVNLQGTRIEQCRQHARAQPRRMYLRFEDLRAFQSSSRASPAPTNPILSAVAPDYNLCRQALARSKAAQPPSRWRWHSPNPYPCGHAGSEAGCRCSPSEIHRYLRRLSGPVLDRIDLRVQLHPVPASELLVAPTGEPSATVRERVIAARTLQYDRGQQVPNAQLDAEGLDRFAPLDPEPRELLTLAAERFRLSGRGLSRLVKVARTLADLDGAPRIATEHLVDALAFRASVGGE